MITSKEQCPECGSRNFYTLADGTRVCRKLNHRWKGEQNADTDTQRGTKKSKAAL